MLDQAEENLEAVGVDEKIGALAAVAGYWSEANCARADHGPELFVAATKDWKKRKAAREQPPPRGRIPRRLSVRERMERKLLTKRRRGQIVEPVFGQVKVVRGCDPFMRRGYSACRSEGLICADHNLLKVRRHLWAMWGKAGGYSALIGRNRPWRPGERVDGAGKRLVHGSTENDPSHYPSPVPCSARSPPGLGDRL